MGKSKKELKYFLFFHCCFKINSYLCRVYYSYVLNG